MHSISPQNKWKYSVSMDSASDLKKDRSPNSEKSGIQLGVYVEA